MGVVEIGNCTLTKLKTYYLFRMLHQFAAGKSKCFTVASLPVWTTTRLLCWQINVFASVVGCRTESWVHFWTMQQNVAKIILSQCFTPAACDEEITHWILPLVDSSRDGSTQVMSSSCQCEASHQGTNIHGTSSINKVQREYLDIPYIKHSNVWSLRIWIVMKYHYHGLSLIKHPPEFADDHVICSRISNAPILSFSTNFQMLQIDHRRPFVDPFFFYRQFLFSSLLFSAFGELPIQKYPRHHPSPWAVHRHRTDWQMHQTSQVLGGICMIGYLTCLNKNDCTVW